MGVTPYDELDRAQYPFALTRNPGWNTLHVDHAVSGVSETFHPPLPQYRVAADREYTYSALLRPLSREEISGGVAQGPAVCAPQATLTAPSPFIEVGGSAAAQLRVTNPCRNRLTGVSVRVLTPAGWTASPASARIGSLAPGETRTVEVAVSGGTLTGRHVVTAEVTATSERFRESVTADLVLTAAGTLIGQFSNVGIGDDGQGNADFDGGGFYYSRQNLAAKGVVAGQRLSVPGTDLSFELANVGAGRPDNLIAGGQRIDLSTTPAGVTKLSFIGAAIAGNAVGGQATVTYTDGTNQQIPLEFGDWCLGGNPTAPPILGNIGVVQGDYRNNGPNMNPVRCWMFSTAPVDLQAGKRVASVTMPTVSNLHVFAVADNGTRPTG